jgi:hypothetical protein
MKHEEIFERLDPPRGGLAKLRERLDEKPSMRVWRRFAVAAPFALAALAVVFLVVSRVQPPDLVTAARHRGGLDQVELGLSAPPAAPIALAEDSDTTAGFAEVRTSNPNVVFAWIVTTK